MAEKAGTFPVLQTAGCVVFCTCGIPMTPNAANICAACLRSKVDITERLQKHFIIIHCPECDSYLQPPRTWIKTQRESKQLLSLCLKKLNNLNELRLIHAEFIWTEPHSKRIKVKLIVQKEVLNGVVLEQTHIVDYHVQDRICESCSRVHANPDQWVAVVQLRQQLDHRKIFVYLRQVILKHAAAVKAVKIKQISRGIDFFFANVSDALKFVNFVEKIVPVKRRHNKVVSHDTKSNKHNYKYTFSVEIYPICREDLVRLPPGTLGPLVICTEVSNCILLLDPFTLKRCKLGNKELRKTQLTSLLSCKQLVRFVVLNVDPEVNVSGSRYTMADVEVARVSDFGKNDRVFMVRSHLGGVLKPGDYALGYDLHAANVNDIDLDKYKAGGEVILVKKSFDKQRKKTMKKVDAGKMRMKDEYEKCCRDLEANLNISLCEREECQMVNDENVPSVTLEQLVADIKLSD